MTGGGRAVVLALLVTSFLLSGEIAAHGEGSVKFGYTGNATANWGNLCPDYKTCSTGTRQSPINIDEDDAAITKFHGLGRHYIDANATLINNGYNVMLNFDGGAGFLSQDGKNYTLKQLHWHTPSEHTINNKQFPLELHLVHQSEDGDYSVVGILYEFGEPNPFIRRLKGAISKLAKEYCSGDVKAHLPVGLVRTKGLKRRAHRFFKYAGSLTTPPCTENVTWHILGKVRKVSKEQIALLRSPLAQEYHNNARPTQALNGRVVQLFDESKFNHHSN